MKQSNREKINEFIRYLIIGFSTTLINWLSAIVFEEVFGMVEWLGTALSWIIAIVFFAFWAYKFFVFRSRSMEKKILIPEFIGFTSARLLTLAFETGFIFVFVNLLGFNQALHFGFTRMIDGVASNTQFGITVKEYYVFKFIATVFVTILNYIASKLIIFRNANKSEEKDSEEADQKN